MTEVAQLSDSIRGLRLDSRSLTAVAYEGQVSQCWDAFTGAHFCGWCGSNSSSVVIKAHIGLILMSSSFSGVHVGLLGLAVVLLKSVF